MQDNRSRLETTLRARRRDPTDGVICFFGGDWDCERVAEEAQCTINIPRDVGRHCKLTAAKGWAH